MGGIDAFIEQLPQIRSRCIEDKVAVDELAELVGDLRAHDPRLTLIAAGGVNPENAGEYAATGVDGLATTAPVTAEPIALRVRPRRLG